MGETRRGRQVDEALRMLLLGPGLCRRTTLGAPLMLLQSQSAHRQTSRPWPHRRRRAPPGAGPDERARGKQERSEEGGAKKRR